jgi:hypothetical protein
MWFVQLLVGQTLQVRSPMWSESSDRGEMGAGEVASSLLAANAVKK